ncbi:hypothetical protein FRB93_008179 [Tulasnella sp. JGI-2019a]|nr:hypothetical protein FRB93_008179 [Tulasnella sp. JGI-2019a]
MMSATLTDFGIQAGMSEGIDQASGLVHLIEQTSSLHGLDESERILQRPDLLQPSYKPLGQRIQSYIANMTRHLNYRAPIYRLPDEILIKIFALPFTSRKLDRPHLQYLVGLGLVSKDWNRIIFETPSLWARISSSYTDEMNIAAILRSKEHSLRVNFNFRDSGHEDAFFDIARREVCRWQSAEFEVGRNSTLAALRDLVSLSAPRLERLEIDCREIGKNLSVGEGLDIFGGGADCLRHVSLLDFPIPWNTLLLSRLETLAIQTCYTPGPSTSEITDILRRCPKLRTLQLIYSDQVDIRVSGAPPPEAEPIHLPFLTSCCLDFNNVKALNRVMSSVRIPACTQFYLHCDMLPSNNFSNGSSHLTPALLPTTGSILKTSFNLSSFNLALRTDKVINIKLYDTSSWDDLTHLIEYISTTITWPPISATIWCDKTSPFLQAVDILLRVPSIVKLTLIGNSDQYIDQLSHPMLNDGIFEWVLPNLRELWLANCPENSLQLITDLSRMRQGRADMDRGNYVRLGLPTKLERIQLPEPLYTIWREIKREDRDGNMIKGQKLGY